MMPASTNPTKAMMKKWGSMPPGTIKGPMSLPVSYNVNAYQGNEKLSKANKGVLRARAHNPVA